MTLSGFGGSNRLLDMATHDYTITVLLVDDQMLVREKIRLALQKEADIDFHSCADPASALAVALECKPTVILQDLVLQDSSGLDLLEQYRHHPALADVPVIMLSSTDEPTIKKQAFIGGANDYVVKSYDTIELIARIRYHSRFYINLLQRNAAYAALRESQQLLQEKNAELERLTNTDGLTGIANRRYFDDYLATEWRRAQRDQNPLSLLLMDVDHFKRYNDKYGHVAGDSVLQEVAAALNSVSRRPADLAARYGGEEFALILPNTTVEGALILGEKMLQVVLNLHIPHAASTTHQWITISIGAVSLIPAAADTPIDLIERADACLYRAKENGRNQVAADL